MILATRALVAGLALAGILVGEAAAADTLRITDSAGRVVEVPGRVERVYAAGRQPLSQLW